MLTLFYDTETTGFVVDGAPASDPRQPYLLEFGAALYDGDQLRQQVSLIVKPRNVEGAGPYNFTVPEEVAKIHGITDAYAMRVGVYASDVFRIAHRLFSVADRVVCHNLAFDRLVMEAMAARFSSSIMWPSRMECTKVMAEPVMRLPPTPRMVKAGYGNKFKSPNLTEAHRHFLGRDFEGAHTALSDAMACAAVWFAMQGGGQAPAEPEADFPM